MRKLLATAAISASFFMGGQALADDCPVLKQLGKIQLQPRGNLWGMPVLINGTPKVMMLDTGTGHTLITPETVEELHLPKRPTSNALLLSSTGERSYGYTNITSLALGTAVQIPNYQYIIDVPLPKGAKRPDTAAAGSVGLELLSLFDFDMDLKNGVFNIFGVDHCAGQVVYWKTDAAMIVPFSWDSQGRIRLKVTLDGTQLYAVLDTTSPDDTLNLDYYKSLTKFDETAPDVQLVGTAGDGGKIYRHTFGLLDLGGIGLKNASILVREDKLKQVNRASTNGASNMHNTASSREPDITLGVATIAKLHVYVASKEEKLYISAAPAP